MSIASPLVVEWVLYIGLRQLPLSGAFLFNAEL